MTPDNSKLSATAPPHPPPPQKKKSSGWIWLVLLCIAAAAAYFWYPKLPATAEAQAPSKKGDKAGSGKAVPVVAAKARKGDMPVYLTGLGSVTALNTVTVHTRVDGELMKVAFTEGQLVNKDDLLVQIDPRPFQVQLEQAEGQMARD